MLLHSPPLQQVELLSVRSMILGKSPQITRELAVVTNSQQANTEFIQHAPEFLKAGGRKGDDSPAQQIEPPSIDSSVFDVANWRSFNSA